MNPVELRRIGTTDLRVTRLGLGGGPLRAVTEATIATVQRALALGLNYIDTAPLYGLGTSERCVGRAVAGVNRDRYHISTKVGRLLRDDGRGWTFDFSRDGVARSWRSSRERLGLDRVDILFLHDPDDHYPRALREGYPALAELRAQGRVTAIGAGMNQWEMELQFAQDGAFDCFLLAGRYTLLEQTALDAFLPFCQAHDISVIVGGPYNSGILASDLTGGATYNYRVASVEVVAKARRIKAICDAHGVPLKAAALQFVLAHPAVASVIPGTRSPDHLDENYRMIAHPIPAGLWTDLRDAGLLHPDAPLPP
jgi:D-threo-aldose 1-dehydrogenase